MKDNLGRNNTITNLFLRMKGFYLLLIAKIKSLFQRQGKSNQSEEPEIWFDAEGKSETKNEIDEEEEFFDAPGYDKDLENENTVKIEEDEGYISSSSQDENATFENVVIEDNQYYNIHGLQKSTSLSGYGNDVLALAFGGEVSGKIINNKYSLANLKYDENLRFIIFTGTKHNSFILNTNSFNIYMPAYFKNNQSKLVEKAFGDSQVVILLQKPESVNLPPKGMKNWIIWQTADKTWMKTANNPIKIRDDFPFDFISFDYSSGNNGSIRQFINRDAEYLNNNLDKKSPLVCEALLSMVNDISSKQEKIDWNIKDILVRGDCISLVKELVNKKVSNNLDSTNTEQIKSSCGNHI